MHKIKLGKENKMKQNKTLQETKKKKKRKENLQATRGGNATECSMV